MEGFDPESMGQSILGGGAAAADVRTPAIYQAIEHIPPAHATLMWNWGRSANTILKGPKQGIGSPRSIARRHFGITGSPDMSTLKGRASKFAFGRDPRMIRSTFSPRYMFRGGSYDHVGGMGNAAAYTPFNTIAGTLDKSKRLAARASGGVNGVVQTGQGNVVSAGFMGRLTASSRLGMFSASGSKSLTEKQAVRMQTFLERQVAGGGFASKIPLRDVSNLTRAEAAQEMMVRSGGGINRLAGGFFSEVGPHGASHGIAIERAEAIRTGTFHKGPGSFEKGANAAARWGARGATSTGQAGTIMNGGLGRAYSAGANALTATGEKAGIRAGLKTAGEFGLYRSGLALGVVSKFAGPVGWAMMAYDLMNLAAIGVKSAVNLAGDAVQSFKGSVDKPAFGGGYRDNTVAATSRQRGVMAIQNSRLNARSVLGSEAAMMSAHFG